MQVILDSSFARPGSAPIRGGKKGEFWDWTREQNIAGMEIWVFRNENSSQTNAYSHYSNYSYSGLIPNERALSLIWRTFSLGKRI